MTYDNTHLYDLADDAQDLLMASLSEVDGQPVLHAVFSLKTSRLYDPDIHGILLNGMPPRFMVPLHPYTDEDTGKREVVQVASELAASTVPDSTLTSEEVATAMQPLVVSTVIGEETVPPVEDVPMQEAIPSEEQPKKNGKG